MNESNKVTHSNGLVQALRKAQTAQVPEIVREIQAYRRWTEQPLRRILGEAPDDSKEKLHASLALLPIDSSQVDYLYLRLLAADPTEMAVLRDSLAPHHADLSDRLWKTLRDARPDDARILPVASVLAGFEPTNPAWSGVGNKIAGALVRVNLDEVKAWREALESVRGALLGPLERIYREKGRPELELTIATELLVHYAADEPGLLVDLLLDADRRSFSILFPAIDAKRSDACAFLLNALAPTPAESTAAPSRSRDDLAERAASSPEELERSKDRRAARGARAAAALVRLGQGEKVWNLLQYSPDPRSRSAFINALGAFGVDPLILARELARLVETSRSTPRDLGLAGDANASLFDESISKQRALIQALAGFPKDALGPLDRDELVSTLSHLYHEDPDAGIHSAAELILRRWGVGDRLRIEPGNSPRSGEAIRRRWYVNQEGQTMVLIDGPVEFEMGSPASDPDRQGEEHYHRQRIRAATSSRRRR